VRSQDLFTWELKNLRQGVVDIVWDITKEEEPAYEEEILTASSGASVAVLAGYG
jgi:hypothetical protein